VKRIRPDTDAAVGGEDWTRGVDGDGVPDQATVEQALYWMQMYTEILAMEEMVLKRILQLMATQSVVARREVELTNVPVVVAQSERYRQRLGYLEARVHALNPEGVPGRAPLVTPHTPQHRGRLRSPGCRARP